MVGPALRKYSNSQLERRNKRRHCRDAMTKRIILFHIEILLISYKEFFKNQMPLALNHPLERYFFGIAAASNACILPVVRTFSSTCGRIQLQDKPWNCCRCFLVILQVAIAKKYYYLEQGNHFLILRHILAHHGVRSHGGMVLYGRIL